MNELIVAKAITSLDVAEMMGIEHWEVTRKLDGGKDRKGYIEILTNNQMVVSEYFEESTYQDASGKENKCYNITKMGCEFLANKFTGEKGIIFTAKYVKRFNEMEQTQPKINTTALSPELQMFSQMFQAVANVEISNKELKQEISDTNTKIDSIKDTILLDHDLWRSECNNLINKIAKQRGGTKEAYREVWNEAYSFVDQRAGSNLKQRIANKQDRLRREGICKSKIDAVNQVDIISEDKKLKEIYIAVVQQMAIKQGVA